MERLRRLNRIALLCLASLVLGLPAVADVPLPTVAPELESEDGSTDARPQLRRLTTAERWRGRPYLRTAENQDLRRRALGRSLPLTNRAFAGSSGLLRSSEDELVRQQALDKAIPVRNPAFVGAIPAFRGVEADPIRRLILDQRLPLQGPGFSQGF